MWAGAPPPFELIRLIFCRDVYHCTPAEFYKIPARYLLEDMTVLEMESEVFKKRSKKKAK